MNKYKWYKLEDNLTPSEIGSTTLVMEVSGGCIFKYHRKEYGGSIASSMVFVPQETLKNINKDKGLNNV